MQCLAEARDRSVWHVAGGEEEPAVYLIRDRQAGGILVNTPTFDPALAERLREGGGVHFLFLPSRHGAQDLDRWREALGAEALAGQDEVEGIEGTVDRPLDGSIRLSRTVVFYTMSGRTAGSTALFCKNKPGFLFLGPILEPGEDGWPTLVAHADDWSWENRVMGGLGLQDLKFEYVFTDWLDEHTRFGPGAAPAVRAALERFYA
ncbi:hypothetical protein AN478_02525 [Thiohalorhabdus denitrificans]|uniref:Uncharacterized protein n=1 Tax=Thiohalorhabdus denitrificans TaxID=381306 RepID=A0A0P9CET6_9GAMM|nr:hypothetical protein [Thiohalorhabdus denitrificans]KPV41463.1 hypothetical protein AN478_02525 [Thiohalorhabdus denitrificans]SCY28467.1 hypothetical protein SAMN05661077_1705 [Thiohalorhabdus denitrificans]